MKKGIIFTGCSYTFGSGLERESGCPESEKLIPQEYNMKNVTYAMLDFIKANRFSKLVCDMLDCEEFNNGRNGGDVGYCLSEVARRFKEYPAEKFVAIVFQITSLDRGLSRLWSNKEKAFINFDLQAAQIGSKVDFDAIFKLVNEYESIESVIKLTYEQKLKDLENELRIYEEQYSIPVFIIHWRDGHPQLLHNEYHNYPNYVDTMDWLKERVIPIEYNGKIERRFVDLYTKYNELCIDCKPLSRNFDDHANLLGNKVIAQSVFNHIKDKIKV